MTYCHVFWGFPYLHIKRESFCLGFINRRNKSINNANLLQFLVVILADIQFSTIVTVNYSLNKHAHINNEASVKDLMLALFLVCNCLNIFCGIQSLYMNAIGDLLPCCLLWVQCNTDYCCKAQPKYFVFFLSILYQSIYYFLLGILLYQSIVLFLGTLLYQSQLHCMLRPWVVPAKT